MEATSDNIEGFFDITDPETVLALMYNEAFRRAKRRNTDYIV